MESARIRSQGSARMRNNGGMEPNSRRPHLVRGSSAAGVATFVALFSHVLVGGEVPGPLGICAPSVLSLLVCVLLAGRKLSLLRLSASVIASQTLFHALFVLGAPSAGGGTAMSGGAHQHHGQMALELPAITGHTVTLLQGSAGMWASHLIGAAVTVLFLYRGEQTIHRIRALAERIAAWLGCHLVAPLRAPVASVATRVHPVEVRGWTVLSQMYVSVLSRRGPPLPGGIPS